MAAHDEPGPHALGPRGADVVLAHHLQQRRAHHARGDGGIAIADRDGGPDQRRKIGDRVIENRDVADLRQPVEQRQQRQDDQHPQPERRDRQARHGQHPHRMVDPGVSIKRRDGPERYGYEDGNEGRHQRDLKRDRYPDGDFPRHGIASPQRIAEIQPGKSHEVIDKLHMQRLVQPQALALGLDRLLGDRRTVGPELHHHHVARHHPDQEKYGHGHPDQRRDDQEQAADEKPGHGVRAFCNGWSATVPAAHLAPPAFLLGSYWSSQTSVRSCHR